jgi:predicted membrane-bound dolichyl-phosphate-mannose-protein mannosyltransferase
MTNLLLTPTNRYYGLGTDIDDYTVVQGDRPIGRIFKPEHASLSEPWFWTITARGFPASVHNKGYAATREEAMAAFKARWLGT